MGQLIRLRQQNSFFGHTTTASHSIVVFMGNILKVEIFSGAILILLLEI
jgi:hypothetical protein